MAKEILNKTEQLKIKALESLSTKIKTPHIEPNVSVLKLDLLDKQQFLKILCFHAMQIFFFASFSILSSS